ncbi:MAG: hypothetical protein WEE89_00925 [Gemmatimonadota bacterium]
MAQTAARDERSRRDTGDLSGVPAARVRDEDLEPHAGLRYIARLFKVLAILLGLLLVAEVIMGFSQEGTAAIGTLLVQATRLIVFSAFLWAAGDMALMLIESNHDLRATRILLGRINSNVQQATGSRPEDAPPEIR